MEMGESARLQAMQVFRDARPTLDSSQLNAKWVFTNQSWILQIQNMKKQRIYGFRGAISLIKVNQERDWWYTVGVVLRPTSLATLTLRLYWRGVSLDKFLQASIASNVLSVLLVLLAVFYGCEVQRKSHVLPFKAPERLTTFRHAQQEVWLRGESNVHLCRQRKEIRWSVSPTLWSNLSISEEMWSQTTTSIGVLPKMCAHFR